MDSVRHVIGRHLTEETRVQNAFDDVAMNSSCLDIGFHSTEEMGVQNAFDDVASINHQFLPATDGGTYAYS
jgi:hypothetical protein